MCHLRHELRAGRKDCVRRVCVWLSFSLFCWASMLWSNRKTVQSVISLLCLCGVYLWFGGGKQGLVLCFYTETIITTWYHRILCRVPVLFVGCMETPHPYPYFVNLIAFSDCAVFSVDLFICVFFLISHTCMNDVKCGEKVLVCITSG